jgi:hypothetical protein
MAEVIGATIAADATEEVAENALLIRLLDSSVLLVADCFSTPEENRGIGAFTFSTSPKVLMRALVAFSNARKDASTSGRLLETFGTAVEASAVLMGEVASGPVLEAAEGTGGIGADADRSTFP